MTLQEIKIVLSRIGVDTSLLNTHKEGQLQISCPLAKFLHETKVDTHPSMGIKYGSDVVWTTYHCFTCKNSGKLWDLVETVGKLENREDLIQLAGHILEYDKPSISARFRSISHEKVEKKEINLHPMVLGKFENAWGNEKSKSYLQKRGVTKKDCFDWRLRYDTKNSRIVFPVRSLTGALRGAVGRAITREMPKYYNYFGFNAGDTLGGLDHLRIDCFRLILVEGFFDLLRCYDWAHEINADVLCTWSANLTKKQADIILGLDKSVIICYDMDSAGVTGGKKAQDFLRKGAFCVRRSEWLDKDLDVGAMKKDQFLTALGVKK